MSTFLLSVKIVVVHNDHRFGGGSDVVAAATVRLLHERGHEVIPFWRDSKQLRGAAGKLQAFGGGIYSPASVRDLKSVLERTRPDIVHAHDVYPLISPWIFRLCQKLNIPTVLTCHDYRMTCPACTHMRQGAICTECLDRRSEWPCARHNCMGNRTQSIAYALRNATARKFALYHDADYLVTPSEFARQWLIEHGGVSPERIASVGNPVAAPHEQIEYLPEQRDYVGFIGRFAPEKGVDVLLKAAVIAGVPVRLAGDHREYRPPLENPLIRYEGQLSGKAWENFFTGMRVLVMPSIWFETFGLVAAEAMMRGVPVICSNLGAMSEMVENGITGFLFPPGDTEALAKLLSKTATDLPTLRRMSARAQIKAHEFRSHRYLDRLESVYRQAQAAHQPRLV